MDNIEKLKRDLDEFVEKFNHRLDSLTSDKKPFCPTVHDEKFFGDVWSKIHLHRGSNIDEDIFDNFGYSRTKEIAQRKVNRARANNELVEYQEIYGRGEWFILFSQNAFLQVEKRGVDQQAVGFKDEESARAVMSVITGNCKKYIRGAL